MLYGSCFIKVFVNTKVVIILGYTLFFKTRYLATKQWSDEALRKFCGGQKFYRQIRLHNAMVHMNF